MKKILSILMVVLFAFTLGGVAGCVPGLTNTKAMWDASSPKSKAVFFNEVYTQNYDEYLAVLGMAVGLTADEVKVVAKLDPVKLKGMIAASSLNEDAREVLRYKKAFLKKLELPIDIFSDIAVVGLAPTPEQERIIVELLNQLKYKAYMK